MININLLRNEPERVKKGISAKRSSPELVDRFLEIDQKWRSITGSLDALRAERKLLKQGDAEKSKELKEKVKTFEEQIAVMEKERDVIIEQIPNLPADDVPEGYGDTENVVLREVGKKPSFDFKPKEYIELADGMINTEAASRVAGSRFGYILGDLVLLEFALVKLAMDRLTKHGFIPVVPPVMAKPSVMKGMGKVKFLEGDDAFYLAKDDLFLVGSSEHTIGPLHMDSVLPLDQLPKRYVGFSTCFRREAGSYGKDTKGILRVHQFDNVEMFSITKPEDSEKEYQFLVAREEELMQALGLHYRVMNVCTGDMGFEGQKQFDIETWLPGQDKYRETHSCSNTTDFQSRALGIKYKAGKAAGGYVHMLNGTAFAIGRMLIAIIENYQDKNGDIVVPEVLRAYVGKSIIKTL